jgi:acyl-CoA thioester hydrolase
MPCGGVSGPPGADRATRLMTGGARGSGPRIVDALPTLRAVAMDRRVTDPAAETRAAYRHLAEIPTRWADNDVYGHVNNATYYSYFDTAVNRFLIDRGLLDLERSTVIGIVVETLCRFHRSLAFPDVVEAGLRVAKLGNSSVRWEIGLFRRGEPGACATGHFVHVYVDRATQRPVPLPADVRAALGALVVEAR